MADCKPERTLRRHGGEVWTCKCGTVGVTYNGVTIRYSPRDFKRLTRLMRLAELELVGKPAPEQPSAAPEDGTLH